MTDPAEVKELKGIPFELKTKELSLSPLCS
jgi:hypothetical protein